MNIVFTGFMGTGKTSVGRKVARKLDMKYIDTDEVIEKDVGAGITQIFQQHGEAHFREVESKVVKCVSMLDGFVICTGGGVVLSENNMKELEKKGRVICLTAEPAEILKRTKGTNYRPLLNVEDPEGKIRERLAKRERYYKKCSVMIDTTGKKIDDIVTEVLDYLEA